MKIKLNTARQSLWRQTPCTNPYVTRNLAFERTPRFHLNSIYHKDDVHKPKKVFTDFEKPQLLVLNFRRQLEEAQNMNKYKKIRVRIAQSSTGKLANENTKAELSNPQKLESIISKLYKVPQRNDFKFDAHGNRCNLTGEFDIKQILQQNMKKRSFTSGRRTDLSKPHNFYPGPGAYFTDRKDSNGTACKNQTCINFRTQRHFALNTQRQPSLLKGRMSLRENSSNSKEL